MSEILDYKELEQSRSKLPRHFYGVTVALLLLYTYTMGTTLYSIFEIPEVFNNILSYYYLGFFFTTIVVFISLPPALYGIWRGRPWGWYATVAILCFSCSSAVITFLGSAYTGKPGSLYLVLSCLVQAAFILYYCSGVVRKGFMIGSGKMAGVIAIGVTIAFLYKLLSFGYYY